MRVYNFPSDEIHIKNNKGEELAKIGPDGVEIDGTSFPVVSVEDAGKTLVVNDEGKIVAGEAGTTVVANPTLAGTESALEGLQVGNTKYKVAEIPTIEITQTEIGSVLLQLASDLNDATGDFQYKIYEISDASIAASLGAKISAAYAKGSFANLSVYGMGTMNCYVTSATDFFSPVSSFYMDAIQKRFALCMQLGISGNNVYITVMFALATEFVPK